eukprot:scaffold5814_cov123-Isochrysis_galbana.AAC.6
MGSTGGGRTGAGRTHARGGHNNSPARTHQRTILAGPFRRSAARGAPSAPLTPSLDPSLAPNLACPLGEIGRQGLRAEWLCFSRLCRAGTLRLGWAERVVVTGRVVVGTGRVVVGTGRVVVGTRRVVVGTGRVVVVVARHGRVARPTGCQRLPLCRRLWRGCRCAGAVGGVTGGERRRGCAAGARRQSGGC